MALQIDFARIGSILSTFFLILALASAQAPAQSSPRDPAKMLADPASMTPVEKLRLAPGETFVIARGEPGVNGFNLHSYVAQFDGRLWVIWSSSKVREEDPDQLILYSTSRDGRKWSQPRTLVDDPDGPDKPARWIARGLYVEKGKLQALGAYIESAAYRLRGQQVVWQGLKLYRFEWNGQMWLDRGVFADDCMNNFPPERLGDAYGMPCRDSLMNVYMARSATPGIGPWSRTPIVADPPFHRMDEPALYETPDGYTHMIVRDNNRSRRLIHVLSRDHGKAWAKPVLTDYPDATSKNFTGRLRNGSYYLINNPDPTKRDPLAISFSPDGWLYSNPLAIRRDAPPARPRTIGGGSFQYPNAVEYRGSLWVVYSTNKQDIEITRIPLDRIATQ